LSDENKSGVFAHYFIIFFSFVFLFALLYLPLVLFSSFFFLSPFFLPLTVLDTKQTDTKFCFGNPNGRDQREDKGIDGRLILKSIFEKVGGDVLDRIHVAEYSEGRRALVNAVLTVVLRNE
jgi:hypothetical protein